MQQVPVALHVPFGRSARPPAFFAVQVPFGVNGANKLLQ